MVSAFHRQSCDIAPRFGSFSFQCYQHSCFLQDFFLEHRDGGLAMKNDAGTRLKSLLEAAAANPCARRDGMMSDTLRNTLFGSFGHDLAARNIFRARDMRMPSYEDLADCFGATPDPDVRIWRTIMDISLEFVSFSSCLISLEYTDCWNCPCIMLNIP